MVFLRHQYDVSFSGTISISAEDADSAWDKAVEYIEDGLDSDAFEINDISRDRFADEHIDPNDERI